MEEVSSWCFSFSTRNGEKLAYEAEKYCLTILATELAKIDPELELKEDFLFGPEWNSYYSDLQNISAILDKSSVLNGDVMIEAIAYGFEGFDNNEGMFKVYAVAGKGQRVFPVVTWPKPTEDAWEIIG